MVLILSDVIFREVRLLQDSERKEESDDRFRLFRSFIRKAAYCCRNMGSFISDDTVKICVNRLSRIFYIVAAKNAFLLSKTDLR